VERQQRIRVGWSTNSQKSLLGPLHSAHSRSLTFENFCCQMAVATRTPSLTAKTGARLLAQSAGLTDTASTTAPPMRAGNHF